MNTAAPAYAHGAGNATTLLSPTTTTQTEQMQSLSSRRSLGLRSQFRRLGLAPFAASNNAILLIIQEELTTKRSASNFFPRPIVTQFWTRFR